MKIRKLQLVGGSSYMVSLPKEWISRFNLKQGDEIILREFDEFVVIQPQNEEREEIRVEVSRIPSYDKRFLKRFLGSIYSLGVDRIILQQEGVGKHITEISEISHHFIGMEVLDCTNDCVVLHIFTIPDFDVITIIKRMYQILSGLLEEIESNLLAKEPENMETINSRIHRHEEDFDRLYLLSVRLVNRGMKKITISEWDELRFMLGSRMIAKFYEEIADILFILSRYLWEYDIDVRREVHGFIVRLEEAFRLGFEAFIRSDLVSSQNFISLVEELTDEIQESIDKNQEGTILKELLIQICRMLESVGEISFNKSVREMVRTY
jgi:phosphate uptake regulator